jgi:hypothetical protein
MYETICRPCIPLGPVQDLSDIRAADISPARFGFLVTFGLQTYCRGWFSIWTDPAFDFKLLRSWNCSGEATCLYLCTTTPKLHRSDIAVARIE